MLHWVVGGVFCNARRRSYQLAFCKDWYGLSGKILEATDKALVGELGYPEFISLYPRRPCKSRSIIASVALPRTCTPDCRVTGTPGMRIACAKV